MKLPYLFRQIHGDAIFAAWMKCDQAPFVRVIPQEPLGGVEMSPLDGAVPDSTITIVTVRCWNDRGTLQFEAAGPADLKVAQEWSTKHRATPPEDFKWVPDLPRA